MNSGAGVLAWSQVRIATENWGGEHSATGRTFDLLIIITVNVTGVNHGITMVKYTTPNSHFSK